MNVELNITELCNLRCGFCPRAHGYPNQNLHMSMETMLKICEHVEEIPGHVSVLVCGRGEPTLHESFDKLMEPLFESKAETILTTNGKNVEKYRSTVERFDYVKFNNYDFYVPPNPNSRAGTVPEEVVGVVDITDLRYNYCDKVFDWLYVDWQGNYNLCCNDWDDLVVLGNVHDMSLLEHNNVNPKLNEYRMYLKTGNRVLSPCHKCDYRIKCDAKEFQSRFGRTAQN